MPPLMVHSWILNFKVKFSHFHFFKVKITNFPSSKRLRLLVELCYILHTSIQHCIKTISVAICLRYSDMMTGLNGVCHISTIVHTPRAFHPPRNVSDLFYFVPGTYLNMKSGCHHHKIGMDNLWDAIFKMAAIKMSIITFSPLTQFLR